METEAVIKHVQEKKNFQFEENMADKEFQIIEHGKNNNQRNPKVNGDSPPTYEINSVGEVGQQDVNTTVLSSVSSIKCQGDSIKSKPITITKSIEDVQKNKVSENIITSGSEDDSVKIDGDVGSEHKKVHLSFGKTDIKSTSANKQTETMPVAKKNAVINVNGSSSALLDVDKSENNTDEKEVKSKEENDVLVVVKSVVRQNSQQTEIALDMTELKSVQKSEIRENISDDSEIQVEIDDKEVYIPPYFENSEEKAHQSDQEFTSCIVEEFSTTEKFNANENKIKKQTNSNIDIEKLENKDVSSQKKRDYEVTISSSSTEIFKEKQLIGNADNGDQNNNNSDPKIESETACAANTEKCPDEIAESSISIDKLSDKVTENEHKYIAKNDQTSILDVSAQEVCDEKNGIDGNSRNDVLTEEKNKIKEDDEKIDRKDADSSRTVIERNIKELNIEDSKSEANKDQVIISGKDDGLKIPMSIEEISVAVISEETEDNRNELSEKYENLIKQKIVQSSVKPKLEERELEMISEIPSVEKENGPSIEDEKNQKHISDAILMEETMDIGLHSGEKSLFNEKDATNMEKLKVQKLEAACDNSKMESEKVDLSKNSGNYDEILENVENTRMWQKLKESNKSEVPSGTIVNNKMEQQVVLVQVQTAGMIEASAKEKLFFKEGNVNIVDSIQRKKPEVSIDQIVQNKGTASIPNALKTEEAEFEEKKKSKDVINSEAMNTEDQQIVEKEVRVDEVTLIEELDTASVINNSKENKKFPQIPDVLHTIKKMETKAYKNESEVNENLHDMNIPKETQEETITCGSTDDNIEIKETQVEKAKVGVYDVNLNKEGFRTEDSYDKKESREFEDKVEFEVTTEKTIEEIICRDENIKCSSGLDETTEKKVKNEKNNLEIEGDSCQRIANKEDSDHHPVLPQNHIETETTEVINANFSTVCSEEKIKNSYEDENVDLKRNIKEDKSSEELTSQQIIRDGTQLEDKNIVLQKKETCNEIGQFGISTDFSQHNFKDSLPVSQFLLDRIMGANSHSQATDSNHKAFAEKNRNVDFSETTSKDEIIVKEDSEDLADKIEKKADMKMIDGTETNNTETAMNGSESSDGTKNPENPIEYKESIKVNLIEIKVSVEDLRDADSITKFNAAVPKEELIKTKIQTGSETHDKNFSDSKEKISSEDGKNVTDLEEGKRKHEIVGKVNVEDNTSTTYEMAEVQDAERFNSSQIAEKVINDDDFELIDSEEIQDMKGSKIGEVEEEENASTFAASTIEQKFIENEVGMEDVALRENLNTTPAKNDDTSNEKILDALYSSKKKLTNVYMNEDETNKNLQYKSIIKETNKNVTEDASMDNKIEIKEAKVGESKKECLVSGDSVDKTESKQFKEKVEVVTTRPIEETILMTEGTELENIISFAVPNEASDSNNNIEEEENNLHKAVANEIHDVTCSMNEGITDKKDSKPRPVLLHNSSEKETSESLRANFSATNTKTITEEDIQNNCGDELDNESANDDVDPNKNIKEDGSYSEVYASQTHLNNDTKSAKEKIAPEKEEADDEIRRFDISKEFNQRTFEDNLPVSQFLLDQIIRTKSLSYAEDSNKKTLDSKLYLSLEDKSQDENVTNVEHPKKFTDSLKEVEMDLPQVPKKIPEEELVGLCDSETKEELSPDHPISIEKLCEIANTNEVSSKNLKILETNLKEEMVYREEIKDLAGRTEEKPEIILKEERMDSADKTEERPDIEMVNITDTYCVTSAVIESDGVEFRTGDTANKSNATVVEQTANAEIQLLPGSKTLVENNVFSKKNIPTEESKNVPDMKQLQTNTKMVGDKTSKTIKSALLKNAENSISCQIVENAEDGTLIAISSSEIKELGSFNTSGIVREKAAEDKVLTEISSSEDKDAESIITSEAEVQDNQFHVAKGLGYVVVRDNKQGEEVIENNDEQFKMMTTDEHVDRVKETAVGDLEKCRKQQEQKHLEVKNQNDDNCLEENLERKDAQDEVKNESEVQVKHVIEKSGHETEGKLSPPNKKQGTIFSGVRSKFKHSISSVKKAMTCSSSVTHLTQETR